MHVSEYRMCSLLIRIKRQLYTSENRFWLARCVCVFFFFYFSVVCSFYNLVRVEELCGVCVCIVYLHVSSTSRTFTLNLSSSDEVSSNDAIGAGPSGFCFLDETLGELDFDLSIVMALQFNFKLLMVTKCVKLTWMWVFILNACKPRVKVHPTFKPHKLICEVSFFHSFCP